MPLPKPKRICKTLTQMQQHWVNQKMQKKKQKDIYAELKGQKGCSVKNEQPSL